MRYIRSDKDSGWVLKSKLTGGSQNGTEQEQENTEKENNKKEENKKQEEENKENTNNETAEKKEEENKKENENNNNNNESKTMYVTANILNLRKSASSDAEIIDQLSLDDKVTVLEEVDNQWCKVSFLGKEGYIAKQYLSNNFLPSLTRPLPKVAISYIGSLLPTNSKSMR